MHMTSEAFTSALSAGKYAWPGGYEIAFLMADGETVCFDCVKENESRIIDSIELLAQGYQPNDWTPAAPFIHWEGAPVQCAHCNRDIESAYGEPDECGTCADSTETRLLPCDECGTLD